MIHFLHTADWQIGRQYGQFEDDDAAFLAQARIDTVAAIAALAVQRAVDAVLVAGDVFDTQGVADRTILRLFDAMAAFNGPWIMIGGNHDAALADSVWTRARALGCLGGNIFAPEQLQAIPFAQGRAQALCAPLTQRHTYDDVTAAFDSLDTESEFEFESDPDPQSQSETRADAAVHRIGVAHGSIAGRLPDTIDSSNPIAPDRASRAKLDYLALGDWHGMLQIDSRTWYSGTPEPDRFRNNEAGNVLEVQIEAPGAQPVVTPHAVGRYRWRQLDVSIDLRTDIDTLIHTLSQVEPQDVLKLDLSGTVSLAEWDRLQAAFARASATARALRVYTDDLILNPDADDLAEVGVDGYVGIVADVLRTMQSEASDAQVPREALRLLLQYQREATRGTESGVANSVAGSADGGRDRVLAK